MKNTGFGTKKKKKRGWGWREVVGVRMGLGLELLRGLIQFKSFKLFTALVLFGHLGCFKHTESRMPNVSICIS